MKLKSIVPAPAEYNTIKDFINPKKQSGLSKSKRMTLIDDVNIIDLNSGKVQYSFNTN